jgi:uncharacterized membrane protein YhdT
VTQTKVAIRRDWTLECLLLLYVTASLVHFSHNAEYAQAYPNLPGWITRPTVYLTWLGITAVGLLGYALSRSRLRTLGVVLLGLYAAVGLDGLLHYTLAPMDAHTGAMNFTIWFEVAVASVLLVYLAFTARRHLPK